VFSLLFIPSINNAGQALAEAIPDRAAYFFEPLLALRKSRGNYTQADAFRAIASLLLCDVERIRLYFNANMTYVFDEYIGRQLISLLPYSGY
jgi:hypothetical protein